MTRTKKLGLIAKILTLFSLLLSFGPLLVYLALSYSSAVATPVGKITLTAMLGVSVILSFVCLLNKYTPRCRLWLILIGLYMCLDSFIGCILVLAITQCVDELVVSPLARHYRNLHRINREIDRRE